MLCNNNNNVLTLDYPIAGKGYTMGAHFGELAKIRGIVYYKLSPYEQKAFSGVLSNGIPNIFRRFRSSVFRVVPRKDLLFNCTQS